jgi:DNA-binding NtrC family response regulator
MHEGFSILFVEDDPAVRLSVTQSLKLAGLAVAPCETAEQALPHLQPGFRGVLITDVRLPGMDGLALLKHTMGVDRDIPVILVTGHGDIAMAVQAMRQGAYDFVEKPFSAERLVETAMRALERRALRLEVDSLRHQLESKKGVEATLLGNSAAMQDVRRQVLNLADTSADVLVFGETGTGKELVARCLHDHSRRARANFVAINCGGIPETLFESEIFGHEAGAFTSAGKRRIGKIEHADKGTLFLDEIESLPMALQVKLLRALQERKLERLGSNTEIEVDFRVVAATKFDLKEQAAQGKFRADLYYRLNVAVIELPPLRERREDIPLLLEHFVLSAAHRHGRDPVNLPGHQMRSLMAADWPGNVRELRNVAERLVLGLKVAEHGIAGADAPPATLAQQVDVVEKALIEQALREHAGRPQVVADALGIGKKTLYDKMHRHGIQIDSFRAQADDA